MSLCVLNFSAPADAAQTTQQILDRVFTFTPNAVLDMATGNAARPPDGTDLGISGSSFTTCALTSVNGLYCIDGQLLRKWPSPDDPNTSSTLLSCADPALGLDKSGLCSGMAVSQDGAIWLAGKKKNGHSVIKVVPKGTSCPSAAWSVLAGGTLCALEYYSGRPTLVDITVIDGDRAASFVPCPGCGVQSGVLGMEERKNAVFFPDPKNATGTAITVVSSRDWGLQGKELLQDVALLQVPNGGAVDSYIVATTSNGRILARNTATGGAVRQLFDIPTARSLQVPAPTTPCNSQEQQYGLRSSSTSSVVYVSDRNFCQLLALAPGTDSMGAVVALVANLNGAPLPVLSTTIYGVNYATIGIAVAPGISIMLSDCKVKCTLVNTDSGTTAARIENMQLLSDTSSGATVFQIRGIPDCRYLNTTECQQSGLKWYPDASGNPTSIPQLCGSAACDPAALWLNVTPLLPADVVSAFKASRGGTGVLPPLLVSPQFRAQLRNNFIFEGLFIVTDPAIQFTNVFLSHDDVAGLEGSAQSLGCIPVPGRLMDWDVLTDVSEVWVSNSSGQHIDTLTNSGCGTSQSSGSRLSLLPYNLELSPDTYGPTINSTVPVLIPGNDAVFARLMQKLYDDLESARRDLACTAVDGTTAPLSASTCGSLASIWANGKVKLDKCIAAAFQPKQSASNENCQSWVSQVTNFRSSVPAAPATWDLANRTSELKARVDTLLHVYYTRFLPSIPANGFCRELTVGTASECANPWLPYWTPSP